MTSLEIIFLQIIYFVLGSTIPVAPHSRVWQKLVLTRTPIRRESGTDKTHMKTEDTLIYELLSRIPKFHVMHSLCMA
jgi:hypothetical protein